MKSAPAIAFDLKPSRWIGAATLAIVALATLAPWLTELPVSVGAPLSMAALAFGASALWRHVHPRFRRAAWRESGWSLVDREQGEHAAVLETQAQLGPLLALGFRYGARARFRFALMPDNLDADTRRRLVLLLARGGDAAADSAVIR